MTCAKLWLRQHRFAVFTAACCLLAFAGGLLWADQACREASQGRVFHELGALPRNDVGLVLGTSKTVGHGRPNLHFQARIDAAARLYHAGKVKHLLVSGDNHVRTYDEPSDMRAALIAEGVPAAAITCDYAGFRTLDSVVRAETVFGLKRCTIVSEEFHCPRALWIAKVHGLDAVAYAAPDVKYAAWSLRVKCREVLARGWGGVDLYLLHRHPKFSGPREPLLLQKGRGGA
ncbi:MAG TPA: ElyC/SanA/YdcF family protein [Terriglobales bacterium]|nr:ElyC/SanA/YdcF family protein [Terriglobales bacterium]